MAQEGESYGIEVHGTRGTSLFSRKTLGEKLALILKLAFLGLIPPLLSSFVFSPHVGKQIVPRASPQRRENIFD